MCKIIIVDDEKLLRQGFIHMTNWQEYGFEIVGEGGNGVEALKLIEELRPNIVITDIRMPVMDGIELTRTIMEKYRDIQVIILSSYDDFDYVKETLKAGAIDYILKPRMEYKELLNVLEKAKLRVANLKQKPFYKQDNVITKFSSKTSTMNIDYDKLSLLIEKLDFENLKNTIKQIATEQINEGLYIEPYIFKKIHTEIFYYIIHKINELGFNLDSINSSKYIYSKNIDDSESIEQLQTVFDSILYEVEQSVSKQKNTSYSPVVSRILCYIHENYSNQSVSLSSVANRFHLNKSYLCQLFKQQTGENFNDYVTKVRIDKAKDLLRQPAQNIYAVGDKVGYGNPSYFGHIFKRMTGMNPSEYARIYHT